MLSIKFGRYSMKSIAVRYRARGTSDPWRDIRLYLEVGETAADRISRFEDENYGTIEIAPTEALLRLVDRKES
jgi:hypothetical protein